MDLLQTVRKEGSRGGVDFKWEDVRNSNHRENYLGHSLMAPVGRWQKGKDLNWYAKSGDADKTAEEIEREEAERKKDELRKVKEAEEDAMARALGLPVPDRSANTEPLGERKLDERKLSAALKGTLDDHDGRESGLGHRKSSHKHDSRRREDTKRTGRRDERESRHHRHRSHERESSRRRRHSRSSSRTRGSRRDDRRPRAHRSRSRPRSSSREQQRYHSRDRLRPRQRERSSDSRPQYRPYKRSRSPYRKDRDRR